MCKNIIITKGPTCNLPCFPVKRLDLIFPRL